MMWRRSVRRVVHIGLALVLGAVAGLATSHFFRPTDAEIRRAIRTLVPPGVPVVAEGYGKRGSSIGPSFEPYTAVLQTSGGPANPEERADLFRRHAEASGWREVFTKRSRNSVDVEYVREGIRGAFALILDEPTTYLETTRDPGATTRRRVTGASIGAVAGLFVGLVLLSVKRSSDQRR